MRELQFDQVRVPPQLIEAGAGHGAEAVGRHFVAGIAQTAESGIHGVHRHRPVPALQGRKDISALAGDAAELPEEGDRLGGEQNDMPLPHLHALGGDAPLRRIQVDLAPIRGPQLAGTNEDERGQLQGDRRRRVSDVAVDAAEQGADLLWLSDGGAILDYHRRQGASQVGGDVAGGPARRDGVPEDLAAALQGSVRGLVHPSGFDRPQHGQELRCGDLGDGSGAEARVDERVQDPPRLGHGDLGQLLGLQSQPFLGDQLEAVLEGDLIRAALDAGIDASGDEVPGFLPLLPGVLQRHVRVDAEGDAALLAAEVILEAPPAGSVGVHQQVEAAVVLKWSLRGGPLRRGLIDVLHSARILVRRQVSE